jgi:hypothetical protein
MSLTHKTTLLDEADTTAVKAYISTMLDSHRDAGKKREVLAYLKRLLVTDKDSLATYHANHRAATELIKTHSQRAELTHEDEIQHLMTADARTIAQLLQLLQVDDGVLFGVNYTFDNTVFGPLMSNETRLVIQGDNARFLGESNKGSAILQELACSCIVKAPLHLKPKSGATEIQDVVIDGVEFVPNTAQDCVTFETKVINLTFTNCIFDGKNNVTVGNNPAVTPGSQCLYGAGLALEGHLVLKNCILKNFNSWLFCDPTTASGTPNSRLAVVDIQDCLFLNNRGSMAFRTVIDPTAAGYGALPWVAPWYGITTFQFINNKIDVSGLTDVHELYWSAVEANNFEKVTVKGNVANCYRNEAVGGTRGFLQVWSKGGKIDLQVENNKLTDFNIGYQLAFGGEPAVNPMFYGCGGGAYLKIGQNDLTRVDLTHSLVYPWLSTTAVVDLLGGALPTITAPSALTADDLTGSLVETFAASSLADIENHVFDVGSNTTGYIQITPSAEITRTSSTGNGHFFSISIKSATALAVTKFWQDQVVLPTNATWRLIEQERTWTGDTMSKRMTLEGGSFGNIPANAAFAMKVYFKID